MSIITRGKSNVDIWKSLFFFARLYCLTQHCHVFTKSIRGAKRRFALNLQRLKVEFLLKLLFPKGATLCERVSVRTRAHAHAHAHAHTQINTHT